MYTAGAHGCRPLYIFWTTETLKCIKGLMSLGHGEYGAALALRGVFFFMFLEKLDNKS